jgi:hypothetical protein
MQLLNGVSHERGVCSSFCKPVRTSWLVLCSVPSLHLYFFYGPHRCIPQFASWTALRLLCMFNMAKQEMKTKFLACDFVGFYTGQSLPWQVNCEELIKKFSNYIQRSFTIFLHIMHRPHLIIKWRFVDWNVSNLRRSTELALIWSLRNVVL